ncbi:MAG: hypothetical protein IT379_24195 [Deltaproteobacteria bacterium]|nr:hypothetical protein [Deltaproteobacteria bacterium]
MDTTRELEIIVAPEGGYSAAGEQPLALKARGAFETLGEVLAGSVGPLLSKISHADLSPDELELRFDLALKADCNWVVVSAGAQATVSATLKWKKK